MSWSSWHQFWGCCSQLNTLVLLLLCGTQYWLKYCNIEPQSLNKSFSHLLEGPSCCPRWHLHQDHPKQWDIKRIRLMNKKKWIEAVFVATEQNVSLYKGCCSSMKTSHNDSFAIFLWTCAASGKFIWIIKCWHFPQKSAFAIASDSSNGSTNTFLLNLVLKKTLMTLFYRSYIQSVLTFSFICWFGGLNTRMLC